MVNYSQFTRAADRTADCGFILRSVETICPSVDVLVARQAIFDRERKLYGYELLYRSNSAAAGFDGTDAGVATMQVLSNTLLSIGTDHVLGGKKAFVNFDHGLLRDNMHAILPKDSIVIEILETVDPTADLVALCRGIAAQGYALALDDFTDEVGWEPLIHVIKVIKVDMRLSARAEQERMLRTYKPRGITMLAEKVETHAEFDWARRAGYDLFQGYFFARPVVVRGHQIPAVKTACLRLLREMQQPEIDFDHVEKLLREDVALTYKLLRYVNSASFSRRVEIQSIGRALMVLGEDGTRRWVALAMLPMLAMDKPSELLTLSLVRARFCERLAELALEASPGQAFLMGMFSLLDALIDQPLDEALRTVDLGAEVTEALLGIGEDDNCLAHLYELILSYEQGNWDAVERIAKHCGLPLPATGDAYLDSTDWAEEIISLAAVR
jgi:EAL and modified HD-GYP domain-containing signal transduction protein